MILAVSTRVRTLLDCRERPRYLAEKGRAGAGNQRSGKNGADLEVPVPAGTVVREAASGEVVADLVSVGERLVAARGGRGGRGNQHFATPTHQAPRRAEPGEPGEERWLELELKLIADVGFVGPPNAGKSTLLARVSRARPRIADYPFTTLEPHLGIVVLDEERQFVAADLPGLIEGAHRGRGLGLQFLRHVERTRALAVLVDASGEEPGAELLAKPRITVLTKADLLPPERRATAAAAAGLPQAHLISSHTGEGVAPLLEKLWKLIATERTDEPVLHG